MFYLRLGVWTNILSVCLFDLLVVLIAFVCIYIFIFFYVYNFCIFFLFLFVAMLLIGHNLNRNYGLHIIGVFNLFEHCISLVCLTCLNIAYH
jgi:hypothetical protein